MYLIENFQGELKFVQDALHYLIPTELIGENNMPFELN